MGKWTTSYYDDVLNAKLKNLVSGAIKRSKLEKAEPTISFESFVEDLDAGDSFTASVIDILVKELAERRTRQTPSDRRLIADRTAKSLRLLATPLRVYQERRRRTTHLTEYLTAPPDEMELDEDDDEFENMLEGAVEGARVNSDLYDAYGTHSWTHPFARRVLASPSPPSTSEEPASIPPPLLSPTVSSRPTPWSLPTAAPLSMTTSLARQSSIRRPPARTRTVDFNEFTNRRRSSIRESLGSRADASDASESREWNRNSQSARRFFPFSRARRHDSAGILPIGEYGDSSALLDATDEPGTFLAADPSPSSAAWFSFPTPVTSASPSHDGHDTETSDERAQGGTPRLRRGGVRAPESMLSRHASPAIITIPHSPDSETTDAHSEHGRVAVAYPTPDPVEDEN